MWMIVAREPLPDQPYWKGRVWLAVLDAVAWPVLWVLLVVRAAMPTGLVGPVVIALAVLFGLNRIHRAVWLNHRYRFTTWRWGKVVTGLMLIGLMMKLASCAHHIG
jgi:hypothetical protein